MENNSIRSKITLKVGGNTNHNALKTAIVGHLSDGKMVLLDCIGVAPNYIATKAIILVRGHLVTVGKGLEVYPIFSEIMVDNPTDSPVKTGIRWVLDLR
ncbi:stage V sporulation protein S [Desulfitobacterium sp. THU1]|uniref:stage V sporulation protein S n=1 Tax=Desulfitobacterium sp. THU1 TaxID=3138072 RepID=UPI00311F37F6